MDKKEAAETANKILDQDERPILLYCYFYTLSFADIGKKLYIDRNTVNIFKIILYIPSSQI